MAYTSFKFGEREHIGLSLNSTYPDLIKSSNQTEKFNLFSNCSDPASCSKQARLTSHSLLVPFEEITDFSQPVFFFNEVTFEELRL